MKQKLVLALQMTMPGAPVVYYGDEAGMWGGDDPDCRKPMVWSELDYEDEVSHPFGKPRPVDKVFFDYDLFGWYKNMILTRKENKALFLGTIRYFLIDNSNDILGFERNYDSQRIYIILNNNEQKKLVEIKASEMPGLGESTKDLVTGDAIKQVGDKFQFNMMPYQILIVK
jgi:glycosidase